MRLLIEAIIFHLNGQKWKKYGTNDLLPMWVADMDFKAAPCIIDSLKID